VYHYRLTEEKSLFGIRFTWLLWILLFLPALQVVQAGGTDPRHYIEAALKQVGANSATWSLADGVRPSDATIWFYAERGHTPAWDQGERLQRLAAALEALAQDGLDPEHYGLSELRAREAAGARSAPEIACTDIIATEAYLTALLHVARGRLNPEQVEPIWQRAGDGEPHDAQRLRLIMLASSLLDDPGAAFGQARPSTRQYRALRAAYADLADRARTEAWPSVPPGPLLREGDADPRVPLLRARLQLAPHATAPATGDANIVDHHLTAAVLQFQKQHGLAPDGIVGPETLAALNVPVAHRLDQIRVNLERMRWLARKQVDDGVVVDIAGARIEYRRNGEVVWASLAQVGRPSRPTPPLTSEVTHLTFHPSWTVPPTILRNDMLPNIRRDIRYLDENRIRVLDHSGRVLDPRSVDWNQPTGILLRQEPGPRNALGRVAIRFPNPFHVYLHDTPSQPVFARAHRQVSSGCVRVQRPLELVDLLIADGRQAAHASAAELLADGETRNFHLTRPIPILIAYWTADVAGDGTLLFRPDIYGRDAALAEALAQPRSHAAGLLQCAPPGGFAQAG
jgi:L,D-transpeptidase YcbB